MFVIKANDYSATISNKMLNTGSFPKHGFSQYPITNLKIQNFQIFVNEWNDIWLTGQPIGFFGLLLFFICSTVKDW